MKKFKKLIGYIGPPSDYSEGSFKLLHKEILFLHPVTPKDKARVIDLLKSMTESLVYSEQNCGNLFEYFCTHNLQAILVRLLKSQGYRDLNIQLFQTANMLVHNISSHESKRNLLLRSSRQNASLRRINSAPVRV